MFVFWLHTATCGTHGYLPFFPVQAEHLHLHPPHDLHIICSLSAYFVFLILELLLQERSLELFFRPSSSFLPEYNLSNMDLTLPLAIPLS